MYNTNISDNNIQSNTFNQAKNIDDTLKDFLKVS